MWNIAICDDEADVCKDLRSSVNQIAQTLGCQFSVMQFCSSEDLLENLPENTDILLLDIKMGDISGIEAARTLRARNNDICIIFITSMTQYAMEGYEVHAFGFIKKPLDQTQLEHFLHDAVQKLEKKRNNEVNICFGGTISKIRLDCVLYIEAFGHQMNMHTTSGILHPSMTLTELDALLCNRSFFRCHKSYLINLNHVSGFSGDQITMRNGSSVFLSKHRKKEFLEAFTHFAGGIL